jgi:hypothetical protein
MDPILIINEILAIAKAIPVVDSWIQALVVAYTALEISNMEKENREAVRKALYEHDQRELEKAVGNPNPGEISGDPGAVVVDAPPPNVVHQP